jgi:hypothetical protein
MFLSTTKSAANSGPPPPKIWLRFTNVDRSAPYIDGVQWIGCLDTVCQSPILLKRYGQGNLAGCLTASPILTKSWSFDCEDNRCLFKYARFPHDSLPASMRLTVQSSGRIWESASFVAPKDYFRKDFYWKVIIGEGKLTMVDGGSVTISNFAERTFSVLTGEKSDFYQTDSVTVPAYECCKFSFRVGRVVKNGAPIYDDRSISTAERKW